MKHVCIRFISVLCVLSLCFIVMVGHCHLPVTELYAEVNIKHASAHCVVPGCNGRRSANSWLCNPSKSAGLSQAGRCHDCKTTIHEF